MHAVDEIHIKGSTTIAPVMRALVVAYRQHYQDQPFAITSSGSGDGVQGLIRGTADIAMMSRAMKPAELRKCTQFGFEPTRIIIAMDGLVPIVHANNKVDNITLQQARDIYMGRITNWADLGGEQIPITPYTREGPSGSYDVWFETVLDRMDESPDNARVASSLDMVRSIAMDPKGIGYVGLGHVRRGVKKLMLEGLIATQKSVHDESYPVIRTLNLYTAGEPDLNEQLFINFVLGSEGQEIITNGGFVPIL